MRRFMVLALSVMVLAACDDSTGPSGGAQVSVSFSTVSSVAASPGMQLLRAADGVSPLSITLAGENGTLELDTMHVIVNEFELERVEDLEDDACDDMGDDDFCEEFEVGPSFVELGMDAGPTTAASAVVPAGEYDELEFEIEDLEDDQEDDDAQEIAALLTEIRSQFPDWPAEASMRVAGSFTPTGGEAQRFVAYFEAEVEIELEFDTPFVVTEEEASRTITVDLDPAAWFARTDGTVLNLAEYDYETTGQVVEFEFEMEHGFEGVEHDDD